MSFNRNFGLKFSKNFIDASMHAMAKTIPGDRLNVITVGLIMSI